MSRVTFLALALAAVWRSSGADATDCSQLPSPIYVAGTDPAFLPTLGEDLAQSDMSLVFLGSNGDCTGLKNILPSSAGGVKLVGIGETWDATGVAGSCDLPQEGMSADIAITGLFPAACAATLGVALPPNLTEVRGPTVPYLFITPAGVGAPSAISAEQAYYVYGYGYYGQIAPWDLANQYMLSFIAAAEQATLDVTAGVIGVSPSSILGTTVTGSANIVTAVSSASSPVSAIGMLSSDVYDDNRTQVNALAFRGYGQDFAWTPDADGGFDKRNVREGRYVMSAPMHFLAMTADGGEAETSGGQTFLDIANGTSALGIDLVQLSITAHLVPECAMQYERSLDGFDPTLHYGLVPSARTQSCDCYFDSQTGGTTNCATCTSICPGTGVCRRGYCEAF